MVNLRTLLFCDVDTNATDSVKDRTEINRELHKPCFSCDCFFFSFPFYFNADKEKKKSYFKPNFSRDFSPFSFPFYLNQHEQGRIKENLEESPGYASVYVVASQNSSF
jgi:hypothetical protein